MWLLLLLKLLLLLVTIYCYTTLPSMADCLSTSSSSSSSRFIIANNNRIADNIMKKNGRSSSDLLHLRRRRQGDHHHVGSSRSIRMSQPREYCLGCQRPLVQCLCKYLPSTKIKLDTEILCLQHPVEFRRKTVSTVPILKLVLENCKVMVGQRFGNDDDHDGLEYLIDEACARGLVPLLLFPVDGAITLDDPDAMWKLNALNNKNNHMDATSSSFSCNRCSSSSRSSSSRSSIGSKFLLVVVDGTWTQAKRIVRESPILLQRCQPVQFMSTSGTSIYHAIRKQPKSFCLSTLESTARSIELLESQNYLVDVALEHLYASLRFLVRTQVDKERLFFKENPESIKNSTKIEMKRMRQEELHDKIQMSKIHKYSDDCDSEGSSTYTCSSKISTTNSSLPLLRIDEKRDLGNGYKMRSLRKEDGLFVDSIWPYRSSKSLKIIQKQIEADNRNATSTFCSCCLGIEYENELVGCILRHRNGALGILHVDVGHRRKGLGTTLVREASRALVQRKAQLFVYIHDRNDKSKALFSKLGFQVMSDTMSDKDRRNKAKSKRLRKWEMKYE